jgi:Ca2+-binding EF-hand superfamily protein/CRP-like cAMP-binding protein/anti-anti-sigma regulatory factor
VDYNLRRPLCARDKYLIFDLVAVSGMDATAAIVFIKIERLVRMHGMVPVWAGVAPSVKDRLESFNVIRISESFSTLDVAEKHVEDRLLQHTHMLAQKWLVDPSAANIHRHAVLYDAITHVSAAAMGPGQLLPYAEKMFVPAGKELYLEGGDDSSLYLLYRGRVALVRSQPPEFNQQVYPGAFFNETVLYAPCSAGTLSTALAKEDSIVLRVSPEQLVKMQHADPHKAHELVLSIFKQVDMREAFRRQHMFAHAGVAVTAGGAVTTDSSRRHVHMKRALQHDRTMQRMLYNARLKSHSPSRAESRKISIADDDGHSSTRAQPERRQWLQKKDDNVVSAGESGVSRDTCTPKRIEDQEGISPGNVRLGLTEHRHSPSKDSQTSLCKNAASRSSPPLSAIEPSVASNANLTALLIAPGVAAVPYCKDQPICGGGRSAKRWRSNLIIRRACQEPAVSTQSSVKTTLVDEEFLYGADYRVPLTHAQLTHYHWIFQIHDHDNSGRIKVNELATFINSTGHGISNSELHGMLHEVGVHEDSAGALTEDAFFEFIRKTLVADLPSSKMHLIQDAFELVSNSTQAELNACTITQKAAEDLLRTLGFHLDETTFLKVFNAVDSDIDGAITLEEFVTCLGMLKKSVLEVRELEKSFTGFRQQRLRGSGNTGDRVERGGDFKAQRIYAQDLVAALGVSKDIAEEMIYIADLEDNQSISFTEFRQVVVNWD